MIYLFYLNAVGAPFSFISLSRLHTPRMTTPIPKQSGGGYAASVHPPYVNFSALQLSGHYRTGEPLLPRQKKLPYTIPALLVTIDGKKVVLEGNSQLYSARHNPKSGRVNVLNAWTFKDAEEIPGLDAETGLFHARMAWEANHQGGSGIFCATVCPSTYGMAARLRTAQWGDMMPLDGSRTCQIVPSPIDPIDRLDAFRLSIPENTQAIPCKGANPLDVETRLFFGSVFDKSFVFRPHSACQAYIRTFPTLWALENVTFIPGASFNSKACISTTEKPQIPFDLSAILETCDLDQALFSVLAINDRRMDYRVSQADLFYDHRDKNPFQWWHSKVLTPIRLRWWAFRYP